MEHVWSLKSTATYHPPSTDLVPSHLVFWGIVELRVVSLRVPIVQQVVVHQVPAPALVVGAKEGHIAVALVGGLPGGDTDDGHRAQGTLPDDLPRVAAATETNLVERKRLSSHLKKPLTDALRT